MAVVVRINEIPVASLKNKIDNNELTLDECIEHGLESSKIEEISLLEAEEQQQQQQFEEDAEFYDSINNELLNVFGLDLKLDKKIADINDAKQLIDDSCKELLKFKTENSNSDMYNEYKKFIILKTIDAKWQDHLYMMDQLREGINLRAYGQKNPLIEYKHEGFAMFESMMLETNKETLKRIFRTNLSNVGVESMQSENKTRNLQTKKNQDILSGLTSPPPQQTSQNAPSFPGAPPQSIVPNQKKEPVKVEKKIGRNEPCPCGSGKKYKKCCA